MAESSRKKITFEIIYDKIIFKPTLKKLNGVLAKYIEIFYICLRKSLIIDKTKIIPNTF